MNAERLTCRTYVQSRIAMMARGEFSWASLSTRLFPWVLVGAWSGTTALVVAEIGPTFIVGAIFGAVSAVLSALYLARRI